MIYIDFSSGSKSVISHVFLISDVKDFRKEQKYRLYLWMQYGSWKIRYNNDTTIFSWRLEYATKL